MLKRHLFIGIPCGLLVTFGYFIFSLISDSELFGDNNEPWWFYIILYIAGHVFSILLTIDDDFE